MTIDNISGCIGCGICAEARPVDAITLAPRKTIPVAVFWG
jgi:ferredoxin